MTEALVNSWMLLTIAWSHNKGKLTFAICATVASGLSWPLIAVALKAATNATIAGDLRTATVSGALIAVGAIGVLNLSHFAFWAYREIAEVAQISLDAELMTIANGSVGMELHDRPEYADKLALLRKDVGQIVQGFTGLFNVLGLLVAALITAVLLAQVDPILLVLPLAAVPPIWMGQRAQRVLEGARVATASTTRQAEHLFHLASEAASAKEIRVARLQSEVLARHEVMWDSVGRRLWTAELTAAWTRAAGQVVFALAYVVAVLLVLRQAIAGQTSIGDVVLVLTLAAQVNQQVSSGLSLLHQLQRTAAGMTRLRWMRDASHRIESVPTDHAAPASLTRGVELHGVGFAYPGADRDALRDVDLLLPAGSIVAFVGENGAGKSTLVKLLCRFYEAGSGEVLVDGVDLRRFPVADWHARLAAGFQDFARVEVTAQETVGIGDLPLIDSPDAVRRALTRASSLDVVDRLEDGLPTSLGKRAHDGTELSGGQWQKLALGRAMMRDTPLVLVLDEPTSALDAEAEHTLYEHYAANARRVGEESGAITVLVSHRFSTVRMADLIVVVGDGGIAETGTHDELIARGGVYAELYGIQAAAYR